MRDPLRLMHTWTTDLDGYGVRRIVQSSVFAADTVLLPAGASVNPSLGTDERRFVERQLGRLRDLGAVELWGLEDDLPGPSLIYGAPRTVISTEEYTLLYERAMNSLLAQRRDFLGDQRALHFDGMTEIILGKHATIHAELCRHLGARSILHDGASAKGYGQFLSQLEEETLIGGVIDAVTAQLGLPDVSEFPDDILAAARANLGTFRARITSLIADEGVVAGPQGEQSLKELVARHVVAEYQAAREQTIDRRASPIRRGVWRLTRLVRRRRRDTSEPLQLLFELDQRKADPDAT